ncbi:MAG TPA: ABC transporter ATP-binding protein [Planctomycetaceae bacterium]|nr:ABC transporter ATP-binding protein [Planctomycetaceae bacterium]
MNEDVTHAPTDPQDAAIQQVVARSSAARDSGKDDGQVQLRNFTLKFNGQTILDRINLSIPKGQTVVVIGESGCGKTMLLKSVVGLNRPTAGEVLYNGTNINALGDVDMTRLRRKFGFVFQNAALFDSMTIGQNVAFPLVQHNIATGRKLDRIVLDALGVVGLPENVAFKRPAELSGGMRKRVGLARALVLNPELLLYDEPTTGLDPIMSDVINQLMMRTRDNSDVTSLIITHDMRTTYKVADRVIMLYPFARLKRGEQQIIFDGTPDELKQTHDKRVSQFVNGEAGERLMELKRDAFDGFGDTPNLLEKYPGG